MATAADSEFWERHCLHLEEGICDVPNVYACYEEIQACIEAEARVQRDLHDLRFAPVRIPQPRGRVTESRIMAELARLKERAEQCAMTIEDVTMQRRNVESDWCVAMEKLMRVTECTSEHAFRQQRSRRRVRKYIIAAYEYLRSVKSDVCPNLNDGGTLVRHVVNAPTISGEEGCDPIEQQWTTLLMQMFIESISSSAPNDAHILTPFPVTVQAEKMTGLHKLAKYCPHTASQVLEPVESPMVVTAGRCLSVVDMLRKRTWAYRSSHQRLDAPQVSFLLMMCIAPPDAGLDEASVMTVRDYSMKVLLEGLEQGAISSAHVSWSHFLPVIIDLAERMCVMTNKEVYRNIMQCERFGVIMRYLRLVFVDAHVRKLCIRVPPYAPPSRTHTDDASTDEHAHTPYPLLALCHLCIRLATRVFLPVESAPTSTAQSDAPPVTPKPAVGAAAAITSAPVLDPSAPSAQWSGVGWRRGAKVVRAAADLLSAVFNASHALKVHEHLHAAQDAVDHAAALIAAAAAAAAAEREGTGRPSSMNNARGAPARDSVNKGVHFPSLHKSQSSSVLKQGSSDSSNGYGTNDADSNGERVIDASTRANVASLISPPWWWRSLTVHILENEILWTGILRCMSFCIFDARSTISLLNLLLCKLAAEETIAIDEVAPTPTYTTPTRDFPPSTSTKQSGNTAGGQYAQVLSAGLTASGSGSSGGTDGSNGDLRVPSSATSSTPLTHSEVHANETTDEHDLHPLVPFTLPAVVDKGIPFLYIGFVRDDRELIGLKVKRRAEEALKCMVSVVMDTATKHIGCVQVVVLALATLRALLSPGRHGRATAISLSVSPRLTVTRGLLELMVEDEEIGSLSGGGSSGSNNDTSALMTTKKKKGPTEKEIMEALLSRWTDADEEAVQPGAVADASANNTPSPSTTPAPPAEGTDAVRESPEPVKNGGAGSGGAATVSKGAKKKSEPLPQLPTVLRAHHPSPPVHTLLMKVSASMGHIPEVAEQWFIVVSALSTRSRLARLALSAAGSGEVTRYLMKQHLHDVYLQALGQVCEEDIEMDGN